MTAAMARKFAFKNLKANRLLEIPFVVSAGVMFILFNIMASLRDNNYVRTRHESLPMLIGFGVVLVGIFAAVFVLYSTNFLLKRRNREFALYSILGLEKKHIRKMISIEFLVLFAAIGLIAICGGHVFGQLTFLGLNRLMRDVSGRLMDYPFSLSAMAATFAWLAVLYVLTVLRSGIRIQLSTPVQLLGRQRAGEGEPKSRVVLLTVGFLSLGGGYYIALTTRGVLSSLLYFFLAALLVILATYLLYVSFSVVILKRQKRRRSYYQPARFLSVSGLLYRMKSHAVSLASISVLSVGVMLTLAVTATIYSTIETTAANVIPRSYQIASPETVTPDNAEAVIQTLRDAVRSTVGGTSQLTDDFTGYTMQSVLVRAGDTFLPYTRETSKTGDFILCYDLAAYNARTRQQIQLTDDEVLLCANQSGMADMEQLTIGSRTFKVTRIENIVPSNYAVEVYCVVVRDLDTMRHIARVLQHANFQTRQYEPAPIYGVMDWSVSGISEEAYQERLKELSAETGYEISSRTDYLNAAYEMDGGFLFLGMVIGLIFLTGAVLITYYKQISAGYEDREKYQTMKKVGLSDELIRKTSAAQIVWMFYAPLAVAVLHGFAASKIIYQLLGLFAVRNFMQYGQFFFSIVGVFFVVYWIIFRLTSRTYYRIVQ